MSLEAVIQENTNTMRELIAVWNKLNAQAKAIDQSDAVDTVVAAGTPVVAKPEKVAKETTKPKAETKTAEVETKTAEVETTEPAAADTPAIAVADVNAAIITLAKAKGRDAAVAVLQQFGVAKVPELKVEQYTDVLATVKKAMA